LRICAIPVRGPLRESKIGGESEPVETPPHPDPLHSPSKTGVNALMASGEREKNAPRAPLLLRPLNARRETEVEVTRFERVFVRAQRWIIGGLRHTEARR
jgi:hypothetical protein